VHGEPPHLSALDSSTRLLLRDLAIRSLAALGTTVPDHFVETEMVRQFEILAASVPMGKGGEERLRQAITRAVEEIDDG
jgi:rhamnose utilization protein RhaD (predicted bifunctional aldolase and dehydrogenase)